MGYESETSSRENASYTLLDCVRELEACHKNNIHLMEELCKLSAKCGTQELNTYMENGIRDTEKTILWMKAAISFLENK